MSHDALTEFATFGDALKYLRRRTQLTLRELGIAVGYSEAHVARLESNQRLPDTATVASRFVEALHLKDEPELAQHLIQLAAQSRGESKPSIGVQPTTALHVNMPIRPLTNLPHLLTHFIGREHEIAEVQRLVSANRLVTLTGSGGTGKTRLAQESAVRIKDNFTDGVWLVELAPLTNPELLADTILMIFGLRPTNQSARLLLIEHLCGKNALVILDNCEHLIEACAQLTEAMLHGCLKLHILATSREPLHVPGELIWRVPSLADDEAAQLFNDRAHATKQDFQLTDQNQAAVLEICAQLGNIPLAIELAASRLGAFSVDQICARLHDRFRLLTGGARTALPRHQTLRALIDWSYSLLSSDEQRLLRWLSVFAGGWTLEMAEQMMGDPNTIDVLAQLVDKSLVNLDDHTDEPRYTMLETIRQFGQDKLLEAGEVKLAHQRHLNLMMSFAEVEDVKPDKDDLEKNYWFDQFERELDNLRIALDWIVQTRDLQMATRMVDVMQPFWFQRGHQVEGIKWIKTTLLSTHCTNFAMRANGLIKIGYLYYAMGNNIRAEAELREALPLVYQLEDEVLILFAEVGIGYLSADHSEAVRLLEQCLASVQHSGNSNYQVAILQGLALRAFIQGDLDKATMLSHDALAISHKRDNASQIPASQSLLGQISLQRGNDVEARNAFEIGVAFGQKSGWRTTTANALIELAALDVREGNLPAASEELRECIREYYRVDNIEQIGHCLSVAAGIGQARGNLLLAAHLLGKTFAIRREYFQHGILGFTIYGEYEQRLPLVRAAMASAEFELAFAEGQQMSLQQAMQIAINI